MKILSTLIMTLLLTTAVYAGTCKEGDTCSKEDCLSSLGNDYSVPTEGENKGKCVKTTQKSATDCTSIAQGTGAKETGTAASGSSASGGSSSTTTK